MNRLHGITTILIVITSCCCLQDFTAKDAVSLAEAPNCGRPFRRIVLRNVNDGFRARHGQFPWMVALGYIKLTKDPAGYTLLEDWPDWRCSGFLITATHVLSAAHCVVGFEEQLRYARMGTLNIYNSFERYLVDLHITEKHVHENYNNYSHSNDIAVLKLEKDVSNYAMIGPICLPAPDHMLHNSFAGYDPFVAGWGTYDPTSNKTNDQLYVAQLRFIKNRQCRNCYASKRRAVIDATVICTQAKRKDSCRGDSGGPVVVKDPRTRAFYAVGIVSYSKGCARDDFPGVNTRVSKYLDWIRTKLT